MKFFKWIAGLAKDKILHLLAGTAITAIITLILHLCGVGLISVAYAWGGAFIICFGKELYDMFSGKGSPEAGDWAADLAGMTITALYLLALLA